MRTLKQRLAKSKPQRESGVDPLMKPADRESEVDKLGKYPTGVRVPVLEGRRYLWTTRVFAIGFYLSMILNVVMVLLIMSLFPLKEVTPFMVTFTQKDDQVVHIEPLHKRANGLALFTEVMARDYVRMREEISTNLEEMQRRWAYLRFRMPEEDFKEFSRRIELPYLELRKQGVNRRVQIRRTEARSNSNIEVYFTTHDYDVSGNEFLSRRWIARLGVTYRPQVLNDENKYENPLGFVVTSYSLVQDR